jgi:hypothetical protein
MKRLRIGFAVLVAGLASARVPARAFAQGGGSAPDALAARNRGFLAAVNAGPEGILEFFPSEGPFTYVHTVHQETGDRRGVWRFPARQAEEAIRKGPLWASFELQMESQPIGLFAHQVMMRGTKWRRVSPTRFVPSGETATSGIFVEWRREGSRWVVSSFGDEGYGVLPLPDWMDLEQREDDDDG